jgi:hypothetical protein
MSGALLELYRHKTWATLRLIEHCQGLADEHLDATIAGTFGTIRETLRHLVEGELGYSILTREPFRSKAAAEAFVTPDFFSEDPVPLAELAERIRILGPLFMAERPRSDGSNRGVAEGPLGRLGTGALHRHEPQSCLRLRTLIGHAQRRSSRWSSLLR